MNAASHDFHLTFDEREAYLYAVITAERVTNDIAEGYVRAICDRCRKTRTARLLIERRVAVPMTNTKAYLVVCLLEEMLSPPLSIAFVDGDELNRSRFDFAIRAADPKEVSIKIFAARREAEEWLTSSK